MQINTNPLKPVLLSLHPTHPINHLPFFHFHQFPIPLLYSITPPLPHLSLSTRPNPSALCCFARLCSAFFFFLFFFGGWGFGCVGGGEEKRGWGGTGMGAEKGRGGLSEVFLKMRRALLFCYCALWPRWGGGGGYVIRKSYIYLDFRVIGWTHSCLLLIFDSLPFFPRPQSIRRRTL